MKIIKCGGKVLEKFEYRKKLYKEIKEENDNIILVVSAFHNSPYSTKSLNELLTNHYSYEMQQEIIIMGEIISSIKVTNELKNMYIDAEVLYKEECQDCKAKGNCGGFFFSTINMPDIEVKPIE